jgi:hypothetical protein
MVIMCEPVQSTCAGTCVARRPTGVAFRCDDHGLDDAQQELNEFVDGVVIIIQCSPVNVGVLQDGSTACNLDLGQASLTPRGLRRRRICRLYGQHVEQDAALSRPEHDARQCIPMTDTAESQRIMDDSDVR